MKKYLLLALTGLSLPAFADKVYLEPDFTVAIATPQLESSTHNLYSTMLTPIVYKNRLLPAGKNIVINCTDKQAQIIQIESQSYEIPVQLGNSYNVPLKCTESNIASFWSNDEYKIKSESVVIIDSKAFSVVPFNAINTPAQKVQVFQIASDGNQTTLTVNKASYFNNALFFATIKGVSYRIQSNLNGDKFTLNGANFEKLLITDINGQILTTIDFPSYE